MMNDDLRRSFYPISRLDRVSKVMERVSIQREKEYIKDNIERWTNIQEIISENYTESLATMNPKLLAAAIHILVESEDDIIEENLTPDVVFALYRDSNKNTTYSIENLAISAISEKDTKELEEEISDIFIVNLYAYFVYAFGSYTGNY